MVIVTEELIEDLEMAVPDRLDFIHSYYAKRMQVDIHQIHWGHAKRDAAQHNNTKVFNQSPCSMQYIKTIKNQCKNYPRC
jgi:hypothetical protein